MGNDIGNVSVKSIIVRGPMLPVAGAFVAGILAGRFLPLPVGFWLMTALAGLLVGVVSLFRRHLRLLSTVALLATVFALGAVRMRLAYFSVPNDAIISYTARIQTLATIRGRVASYPWISQPRVEFGYQPAPRVQFLLEARSVLTGAGWRSASGLVRVTIDEPYKTFQPDDRLELIGWMGRFSQPRNPGQFNSAAAARRNGTMVYFRIPSENGAILLSPAEAGGWRTLPSRWRASLYQRLTESGDLLSGELLAALILGERHPGLAKLNRTMQRAGIAHFLSISGMHLGVFLGFIYLLCRVLTISRRNSAVVVMVALAAYLVIAEPRAPLLRSAVMATAMAASVIFNRGRGSSSSNALAVAAVVLLAFDPRGLLSPGFQLSFVIVGGLILLLKPMRKLLFGRWLDRRGLMVFRDDKSRFKRWLRFSGANWAIDAVALSTTAYLTAMPLVAYHFGIFSPYAIVLGLVLFPFVVATLVPGYLSLGLAWPVPNLAAAFGSLAAGVAGLMARFVEAIGFLPMLCVQLRPVSLGWVLLCYATLAAVLLSVGRRGLVRRITIGLLVAALIGLTIWTQRPASPERAAKLHLLAVGAGQCAVLQTPDGETHIFDAGTRSGFDVYLRTLAPFYRKMRLPDPTSAFVSHANTDHYSALPGMVRRGRVGHIYLCDYFDKPSLGGNPTSVRMMKLLNEYDVRLDRLRAGARLQLDSHTHVEVLWPPAGRTDLTSNDTSLILRITCDGRSVLLPGDLARIGQAELLKPGVCEKLKSDVLILPHHGGWTKDLPEFIAAVGPRIILVSGSKDPHGPATASPEIREFYKSLRKKYQFYSTARHGWIALSFGKTGLDVQTMRK